MRMTNNENCLHEEQIQNLSRKIAEIEAHIAYKDKRIDEIIIDIKELNKNIKELTKIVNNLMIKSNEDDNVIDKRVTSLETTQKTLKWITGLGLTSIATATAVLTFVITIIH